MKRILTFLPIVTLIMLLLGCSTTSVVPIVTQEQRTPLDIPTPAPLQLNNLTWKVITINGKTYFALDTQNYAALSQNMEDIQDQLRQLHSELVDLKNYDSQQ